MKLFIVRSFFVVEQATTSGTLVFDVTPVVAGVQVAPRKPTYEVLFEQSFHGEDWRLEANAYYRAALKELAAPDAIVVGYGGRADDRGIGDGYGKLAVWNGKAWYHTEGKRCPGCSVGLGDWLAGVHVCIRTDLPEGLDWADLVSFTDEAFTALAVGAGERVDVRIAREEKGVVAAVELDGQRLGFIHPRSGGIADAIDRAHRLVAAVRNRIIGPMDGPFDDVPECAEAFFS